MKRTAHATASQQVMVLGAVVLSLLILVAIGTVLFSSFIANNSQSTQSSAQVSRSSPPPFAKPTPVTCADVYQPVCGMNGRTYANQCEADAANVIADCKSSCPCPLVAYFRFTDGSGKLFTFKLTEQDKIDRVRKAIKEKRPITIMNGVIAKQKASYNPNWSYMYKPLTTDLVGGAVEVCDANMQYLQDHLSEAGGAFLPALRWCPWSARLVDEIYPKPSGAIMVK